jgi:hypothetical protein
MSDETAVQFITANDLSQMDGPKRVQVILAMCDRLGLDPILKPIQLLQLQGKLVPYVTKGATDQLARVHGISTRIVDRRREGDVYVCVVEATAKDGRTADNIGAVALTGTPRPDELANAMMKAITKAKRRATLSLIGLGLLVQEEAEDLVHDGVARYAALDAEGEAVQEQAQKAAMSQEEREAAVATWIAAWEGAATPDEWLAIYATFTTQPGEIKQPCRRALTNAMRRCGIKFKDGQFIEVGHD